ncbi:MAG: hypothetical protein ACLFQX_03770 [Candidatus Kapaibacterium sp.]
MKYFFVIVIIAVAICNPYAASADDAKTEQLRKLYYEATENEDKIDPAINMMEQFSRNNPGAKGLMDVYIGSLTAVKARFAFWPPTKLELAEDGIDKMEAGLKMEPDNIEALFIYGTTCYYLPFFFGKSDEAESALIRIVKLIDEQSAKLYNSELLYNALEFIIKNIEMKEQLDQKARKWMKRLEVRK